MPSGSDGGADRKRRRSGRAAGKWPLLFALFLLLIAKAEAQTPRRRSCSFPETASQSFFFDFDADTPAGTTIVNSVVSPPDARLTIGNVRSNNLKWNFADLFQLRSALDGRFVINTIRSLALPPFPSTLNETILYVTVVCNGSPHPLMTVRVRNRNSFAPVFLNEPYEIFVPQDVKVGAVIQTPVVAIDEDPSAVFTVGYELAGAGTKSEFAIAADAQEPADLQALPADFAARRYAREQMPLTAALRVRQPLRKKIYYLNVTATDGQQPPRRSSTLLKVVVGQAAEITPHFSQREYYANFSTLWAEDTELVMNQPIVAYFPERSLWSNRRTSGQSAEDVRYELVPSEYSRLFGLNSQTARLYLKVRPYEEVPSTIELGIRAFVLSNPDATIESKIVLNDVSEVKLTYFAQCHYDVHLPENSPPNTRVTKFVVRGDIAGIDLLNGTEFFDVASDGVVTVAKNARIDYEELNEIVVKAKLRSSTALHPKSLELCQIATIDVKVEDENDHSPRFSKAMFTFYTEDEKPYNNTEIGTIRATDEDRGRFGKVEYRILQDPSTPVPFTLFQSDGAATLYFTQPDHDFYPERSYSFPVEAFDSKENPRTSRVTIRVLLQAKPEGPSESEEVGDRNAPTTTKKTTVESTSTAASTTESAPAIPPMKSSKFVKKSRRQPHRTSGVVNVDGADGEQNPLESVEEEEAADGRREEHEQESNEEEGEATPSGGDPPEEFESRHYNFTLDGPLDAGQFIGAIRLRQDGEEADGPADKPPVEYVAEEGIRGFVRVDSAYGTIRVDSKLIDDSYEQIRFAAQAVRKGRIVATTVVSVFMNETGDVYAQRPRFEQALYRFELVENQPPQQFAQVEAHHRAVELGKDRVWYTLNRERDAAGFRIDPETGWLRSLEPFDAEAKKFYSLKINACLESNTKWCAHAEAIVVIRDENDNAPKFTQPSYNLTIPPDLSAGTDLLQIRAEDADSGLNGEVRYAISSSSASEVARLFKINERTGELRLENSLPADRPHLAVYISAHDLGEPPMESIAEVRIAVSADAQYTNQHAPEFDDFRYEFSKKVPILIGTIVARVHASDPDEGADGRVWYKFAEDTPLTRKFLIDKKNGEIRVISPISRENGDLIQLVVEAHDQSGDFPRKSETVVLLHLLDDETEPLEFLPLPKTVYISTAKPLGSAIFKVGLKNTNVAEVKFSVEQDLRNELFAVIDDLLVVQAKLKPGAYRITIRATATTPAKGQTSVESHSLRMIVMTDREKYPVFEKLSYELKIAPNADFPVKLPAFNATVKEGRIGYSIYNADGKEAVRGIKIDEITGQLTVFKEFVQQITDDLPRGTVFVVVRATNLDHPTFFSDVGVRLGLNTSGRELAFTSRLYRLITKENAPVGSTINTVRIGVQDPALFAGVKYSIEPSEWFDIRENGSVVVKKPIDLETLPAEWKGVVEATVNARYFGQEAKSHVQIKVEDVEEFEPVFDQPSYSFDVDPELPDGEWIGSVHAVDGDFGDRAGLTYRGLVGNALGIVNITNAGRLIKNEGKEFVPGQNYSLIVQAGPISGRTSEAVVYFNVKPKEETTVPTTQPPTTLSTFSSTAPSTTSPTSSSNMPFPSTATKSPMDLLASKLPSKWTPEQPDEKILLPSMPDRSDWGFRIADGNSEGRITVEKVNKTTAQLGLRTEMLGTRPDKPADLIVLEITNLDDPFERHQAKLSVDLQKVVVRPLAFGTARTDLRVELSAADPTKPFGHVDVQCPAADCRFELTENPLGLFAIDGKTGDLFLQKLPPDVPLGDHEALVSVRSGKQTIQRVFTINVRDESGGQTGGNAVDVGDAERPKEQPTAKPLNSATPTRPTTVAPASPSSSSAAISTTTAGGLEMLTSLQEEAQETTFEITSEVTTSATTHPKLIEPLLETLGPSEEPPIPTIPTIRPQVEESGESTTILGTQINVQSTEAPPTPPPVDSKPKFRFEQAAYRFEVAEPKHHVEIGRLNVVGATKAKMRITPDQYRQWFGIDPNTNMLYIREVPAELHGRQRAEFTVIAQDAQNSKARAETTVSIDLLLPDEDGEVRETLSTTTTFLPSTATTTTARPSFAKTTQSPANALSSLLSSLSSAVTPTAAFSSDQTTEETAIFSTVDLSPTVVPSAPPAQPQADAFRFKHPLYTAMLPERQYGNRGTVVNVHPAPLREGLKNVVFSIVTNEPALPFHVRNSTGELIVFDNVDREATNEYRFNISATKVDNPKELTTTEVKVTILDVNDNYPLFVSPPYVVPIDASARPGLPLATFKAVDPDEGPNGRVTYRIVENFENLFDINGKGELSLTTQLPALSTDLFNITISAIDGGRPALRTQHQVQIQVFPDASEQPAFKKTEYTVEVPRGSDVGAFVAQIVAGSIPLDYVLLEDSNGLFGIDGRGIVELRRKPTTDEQNRYHSLTAVAESKSGKTVNTTLNVFVEGDPIVVTVTPAPVQPAQSTPAAPRCTFKSKLYNAEVRENTPGRSKLTTVDTNCKEAVRFVAAQISKEFELNEQTGEVFVLEALDREKKSLHFIVVNLTLAAEGGASKQRRQANHPIAEYTKNKLAANQALVVIKVLDENDNPPVLARLTADQQFVFSVDWQAPLLQPVARIQAFDPDEQPQLSFELSENDFFAINSTTGVVSVVRSLLNVDEEQFDLEVRVSDGKHKATAPLKIYKLAPGLNIAILTVDAPEADVDEVQAARKLSGLLERDVHVLTKQVFISEDGHADPQRTHLFVYALDRNTKIPLDGITLKMLLDQHNASLKDEELPVSGISLPSVSSTLRLTPTEIVLMAVCCCLMVLACCMFFLLLRCCKRRTIVAQPDMKYMVGSVEANPRPYNVELISRKTAQNVLSGRPLPDPFEETTMTPKSRASMVTASGVYAADGSQRTVSSTVTDEMPNQPRPVAEPPVIQIVHPISAKPRDE